MDRGLDKIENILNKIKKIERPKDCSFSSGMAHRVIWQIRIGIPIALGLIALLNHRTRNLIPQDFRYLLIATIVLVVTGIIYYLKIDDNSDIRTILISHTGILVKYGDGSRLTLDWGKINFITILPSPKEFKIFYLDEEKIIIDGSLVDYDYFFECVAYYMDNTKIEISDGM